ncbi:DUF262 domain-containing protein [Campylobacter sp. MOP7]|uniref:DUF262 domain-containing protein n=1 Tax=Campylobacter canis TaxID=3378588 RepID=UPI00387E2306
MSGKREFVDIFQKHNVRIHENSIPFISDLLSLGCGYDYEELVIPDYQRGLVWSDTQKENLIKSILCGVPVGTFVFARQAYDHKTWKKLEKRTYGIVDGQQRYNAIKDFVSDKFRVCGKLCSELEKLDREAFMSYSRFNTMIILEPSREIELDFYFTLNFGGTAHTKEDLERLLEAKGSLENKLR